MIVAAAFCLSRDYEILSRPSARLQQSLRPGGASCRLGAANGVGLQGPAARVGEGRLEEDGLHGQLKRSQQHQGQRRI